MAPSRAGTWWHVSGKKPRCSVREHEFYRGALQRAWGLLGGVRAQSAFLPRLARWRRGLAAEGSKSEPTAPFSSGASLTFISPPAPRGAHGISYNPACPLARQDALSFATCAADPPAAASAHRAGRLSPPPLAAPPRPQLHIVDTLGFVPAHRHASEAAHACELEVTDRAPGISWTNFPSSPARAHADRQRHCIVLDLPSSR
jgi:hypothetical protein